MKRPLVIIIIIVALLAGGAGILATISGNKSQQSNGAASSHKDMQAGTNKSGSAEPTKPNEVNIKDFAFGPASITVKKGTKVMWTNKDTAHHDITPTGGGNDFKASELLGQGEGYSFTFNTVGTYTYKCSPHPYMKAMVIVTE